MRDVIIANATLVDPELRTETPGSIVVSDGKIREIIPGSLPESLRAAAECPLCDAHDGGRSLATFIDASGLVAAPGFIDVHSHTDGDVPAGEKLLAQGVTTAISGNCGISPVDIEAFFDEQDANGYPIHQAELVGHSFRLRNEVGIGDPYRAADDRETEAMRGLARAALDRGAAGISFGIEYAPGTTTREFREIASVAAARGRVVTVHARNDCPCDLASLRETLDIAADTGARLVVSHLAYMYANGNMCKALDLIGEYRARGHDVWADSGMYTDFATYAGTTCFDDRSIAINGWVHSDFLAATGRYAGRRLSRETFLDIRAHSPNDILICFTGVEDDIYKALSFPDIMPSTDTGSNPPGQGHPQGAATFPLFFRAMVRERRALSLVEAVRRATFIPATVFNLRHKGRLQVGADADIVLFDPGRITETAGFPGIGNPDALPEGIPYVLVNGVPAIQNGIRISGVMEGNAIRF